MTEKRRPGRPSKAEIAARAAHAAPTGKAPVVKNRYDAGGTGKRMAGWNPPSTGPNKAISGAQKVLSRARDIQRNDWTGESIVQKWATALIGIGIRPRLTRVKSPERRQFLNDLWDDFVQRSDADGVLNFYGQQTLGVRALVGDGEYFLRQRRRRLDAGLPVPLQVQLIESEFVPMLDADTYEGLPRGNRIRSGIELDSRGQRVAYWMYREHPGDGTISGAIDAHKLLRIPASEVRHVFCPKRPGQLRGISDLAPILPQIREIGNYRDAVLLRQQLANLFVAFLTRKVGEEDDNDPLTGKAISGTFDSPVQPMAPGLIQELEDGQDVKFANPPEAGTTFSDYMRSELMGPAAASGLPYEVFAGDIKEISDRTLRVIINEFRRLAEQKQWQIVIPMACQPVRDWFAEAAALAGKISASEIEDVRRVEWAPHGWAHIHPVQDPQGKKLEIDAGTRSRSSVIAERGDDPEAVDRERAEDQAREKELGIYVDPTGVTDGNGDPVETDGIDNDEYSAPPTALERTLAERAEAEAEYLRVRAQRLKEPPVVEPQMSLFEQEQLKLTQRVVNLLDEGDERE